MSAEGLLVAELSPDQKSLLEGLTWSHLENPYGMDLHYAIRRCGSDTTDETLHHRLHPEQPLDVFELPSPEALIELLLDIASTVNRFGPLYVEDELPTHLPLVLVAMYRIVDGMPPSVFDLFLHRRFEALWRLVNDLEVLFFENIPSDDSRRISFRNAVRESEEFSFRETISGDDGPTIDEVCKAEPSSLLREYAQVFFHNQDDPDIIRTKTASICSRLRDGVTLAEKIVVNGTLLIQLGFPVSEIRTRLLSLLPSNGEISLDPTIADAMKYIIGPLVTNGRNTSVIESIIEQTSVFQRELHAMNHGDDDPLCELAEAASRIGTIKERIALQGRLEDFLSVAEGDCFI